MAALRTDLMASFMAKVTQDGDCWLWTAAVNHHGYGTFTGANRSSWLAHRWIWEQMKGPIPDGLQLDHLCRVRHCVNPDHLEPVTNKVNAARGFGVGTINGNKTHCSNGHVFDEQNTMRNSQGRTCRACHYARNRAYAAAKKQTHV